jgi:hypothetical protein
MEKRREQILDRNDGRKPECYSVLGGNATKTIAKKRAGI